MSRRPFSLSAYLALTRPAEALGPVLERPARPDGPLLWLHAASATDQPPLAALAARITQQSPELSLLKTGYWPDGDAVDLPEETLAQAQDFLAHWRPNLLVWAGQDLRPALMEAMRLAGRASLLVNAREAPFSTPAPRWLPDAAPAALSRFSQILCVSREAERRLRRLLPAETRIERTGHLTSVPPPLDCPPDLHEEVAAAIGGRPVWLAARARAGEMRDIFDAHAGASRLAHRLLLILVPEDRDDAEAATRFAEASEMRIARWDDGDMPDDLTQIVLCESPAELGLWYRLAPLSFLGGSLAAGHGGTDPLEAAALGSAVLYGPNVGHHLATYSRLVDAGAARIVRDAHSLSAAVSQVIAPDRAATMAHAGWDVVTAGAKTEDRIVGQISSMLDAGRTRTEAK
ncbi:3-deoxy-D-manno-octulosonic-acid transferase [Roseivivax halotolerans]|uniref:3-deoxy-D-manno-octulosonic acid transferase n=1 Tax=Roseivivax halotolerans TaxID=93684 RepID=A0A1I5V0M8_9RHOB|nr:glycosyltransferase N-terminal domain-containing protein [Roseivivax halotolerans]SFQ01063.1 3-deoxy-D-manno-octulosonic-acid transferase [Roseivivax halotolerans]